MTMTEEPTATRVSGQRLAHKEDPVLLSGEAVFANDMEVPGALHMAVLRSPYASATIMSIDTSAAAAMPGVRAVYTGADLADQWAAPMPCARAVTEDVLNPPHHPIAIDAVHYVSHGVAVVLADTDSIAHDAIEAIDVAVQKAFDDAAYTVSERYVQQRLIPCGALSRKHGVPGRITTGHSITPSPTNPLGVKGVGEAGTIGSAPAVMNAIVDALSGLGVRDVAMPASPNTVWNAIRAAQSTSPNGGPQ